MKKKIAIIGAGISGLTIASQLKPYAEVVVFEKARGVGGRMSTRYADPFYFDHGAQCFTARTKPFQKFLIPFIEDGTIAQWKGNVINLEMGKKQTERFWFETHLVASPNMNSLCKKLAQNLNIELNTEIAPLVEKQYNGWHIVSKENQFLGVFDCVISTAPPAQTINLFKPNLSSEAILYNAQLQGCYAVMIGFNQPWDRDWIAAKVKNNPIKWISINSTKPNRNNQITTIVVHSRNKWADTHINDDMHEAQKFLIDQFQSVTDINCSHADYISTHRWKYAIVSQSTKSNAFINSDLKLAATSDWCTTSRIEDVWINATQLANDLIEDIQ